MLPTRCRGPLLGLWILAGCTPPAAPRDRVEDGATDEGDPGPAMGTEDGSRVIDVEVAGPSSCALQADGRVRCWGVDDHGEHGDLGFGSGGPSTVQLPGPASRLFRLGSGPDRGAYCAAQRSAAVWCWGAAEGQIGRATAGEHAPVEVGALEAARTMDGQAGTACAVGRDGGLRCWGVGQEGQLGDGQTHVRHRPGPVSELSRVRQVKVGRGHACAVHGEGQVSCWGRNTQQQVAPGDPRDRRASPSLVRGLPPVESVAVGEGLSCARERSGQVWCWGRGSPREVRKMGVPDAGGLAAADRVCAVRDGELRCWRDLAAEGETLVFPGLLAPSPVSVSSTHACAVVDGAVRCRGENRWGQLGDGTFDDRTTPVPVEGLQGPSGPPPGPMSPEPALVPPDGCSLGPLELRHPQFWTEGPFALVDAAAVSSDRGLRIVLSADALPDPLNLETPLRGEQRRVEVTLVDGQAGSLAGQLASGGEGPTYEVELVDVRARRRLTGTDTKGDPVGTLAVERDDEWICGQLDLHARLVTVRGPFAVRRPSSDP